MVELSIVLVILGLLVGGILAGQSLIRASELRSVGNDIQRYVTATYTFRDKYFALPGDMSNATKFWGTQSSSPATCQATVSTTALTCDGDGDGSVGLSNGATTYENPRYWQHLANAGLIEGTYTGKGTYSDGGGFFAGLNAPKMRVSSVTLEPRNNGVQTGAMPDLYAGNYGHMYYVGGSANQYGSSPYDPFMTTTEAWNFDTKWDDGLPAQGKVKSFLYGNATAWAASSANCANSATVASAQYNLSLSGMQCSLLVSWRAP